MIISLIFELLRFFQDLVSGLVDFLVFFRLAVSGLSLLEN